MSDTEDCELGTTRLLDAPTERVFRAFSDAAHLAAWWGPAGFTNTFHAFELRTGATWRYTMHGPNGGNYENESVFADVAPERIVIEHVSLPRFTLTITLAREAGKTRLAWRQRFPTAADCERLRALAVTANEQNLDRLEARLALMSRGSV